MSIRDWIVIRTLTGIATKIWAASGAALLACFILYCFYGGLLAFILLVITVTGNNFNFFYTIHNKNSLYNFYKT